MNAATREGRRLCQVDGTPFSYLVDSVLKGDHADVTLMVPVPGGVVEHDFTLNFGDMPIEMVEQANGPMIEGIVMRLAPQIASAGLKEGDTQVTITEKYFGVEKTGEVPIRFVSTPALEQSKELAAALMQPMTIHYALQPGEQGDDPIAVFSVEIDGGSLSTACLVPDADPAALGSMAGIICNHMHMNAKHFPGDDRSEERTERRHLHYGNGQAGGQAAPLMGEFDVTFTPAEPM